MFLDLCSRFVEAQASGQLSQELIYIAKMLDLQPTLDSRFNVASTLFTRGLFHPHGASGQRSVILPNATFHEMHEFSPATRLDPVSSYKKLIAELLYAMAMWGLDLSSLTYVISDDERDPTLRVTR